MIDRNSEHLTKDDLLDQEATVTIVSVKGGSVKDPSSGKKSRKAIVSFKGWDKSWACGITCAKTVYSIVGSWDPKDWVGKRITIYPNMTIKNPRTGEMGAIRVRPDKPTTPGIPQSALRGAPAVASKPAAREPGADDV